MRRNPRARQTADAIRRAVVTTTALLSPGTAAGPQGEARSAGAVGEDGHWAPAGRFDVTPLDTPFRFSE